MASLKVYYDMLSQPSRAVLLFIMHNKIPFDDKRVSLAKAEHLTDEYEKINPFRKVPTIVDGDFKLTESIGILRYLCREKNVPDYWYPKDSKAQAKIDEYLEWQHLNTRLQCSMYFQCKWLNPLISGVPAKPDRVAAFEKRMISTLDNIEEIWLADTPYLIGDNITIADLLGACEVEQVRIAGYNPRNGRPKMTAWLSRVQQQLHPHYDIVHEKLNKLSEKFNSASKL